MTFSPPLPQAAPRTGEPSLLNEKATRDGDARPASHRLGESLGERRRWYPLSATADSRVRAERITRLLVVDDNVDVRFAMYECLAAEGFDVAVAGDGIQGLSLARLTLPHAILLDLGMPALDGFSTARAMRRMPALQQTPLIAVTGFFDKRHFDDARASGFDYYFQKPVEIEALLDLLAGRG